MKYVFFLALLSVIGLSGYLFSEEKPSIAGYKENKAEQNVVINFLDIGQGDATYLQFADGEDMLVDCAIDGRILEALGRVMAWNDTTIDYLVVTHPDLDHYGGCEEVLKRFEVKHVLYNGLRKENSKMWQSFSTAAHEEGGAYHEVSGSENLYIASTTIEFLYPDHSIALDSKVPGLTKDTGANDTSIVTKVTHGKTSILLMGDAEVPLEKYLIGKYGDNLDVDILKLGHHGSDSSSSEEFLKATTPDDAIVSAGVHNKYGHPSLRVLKRLERVSSNIWRTDKQGDIRLAISTSTYTFSTVK